MADQNVTQLTPITPADDDLLYIVDDPNGTPADGSTTVANLLATQHNHTVSDITDFPTIPQDIDDIAPNQSGNAGKVLQTDGTNATWQTPTGGGASELADLSDVDATVASPSDGDILVYRSAGSDWVLEAKPAAGSNPAMSDITDVVITSTSDNEVLAYDNASSKWINQTASEAGLAAASHTHALSDLSGSGASTGQVPIYDAGAGSWSAETLSIPTDFDDLSDGTTNKAFTSTLKDKLDGIEASADVTDATNVAAAGAVMESDTSTASMSFVIDEDDMSSNSATKVPTQQSVKAYADTKLASSFASGVAKLTVGSTEPTSPSTGDLWVDTN